MCQAHSPSKRKQGWGYGSSGRVHAKTLSSNSSIGKRKQKKTSKQKTPQIYNLELEL
jgi:hypothetical protein